MLWVFWGFLVLVLLIVIASKSGGKRTVQSGFNKDINVRNCPHCAETIKCEAVVCKHCGRDVDAVPLPKDMSVKGQLFDLNREYESGSITKVEYQNRKKAILNGNEA